MKYLNQLLSAAVEETVKTIGIIIVPPSPWPAPATAISP